MLKMVKDIDKLQNKFVIIVPVYNAKELIEDCLLSIFAQSFEDLGVIIRDDMSTDGTDDVIRRLLNIEGDKVLTKYHGKDVLFIRNHSKLYPVGNTYESVINYISDINTIVGVVDGDDSLINSMVVKKVFETYKKTDKWLIWSQHQTTNGNIGCSMPLPNDSVIYNNRGYWSVTHFRTNLAFLFHNLDVNDLKDPFVPNSYYTYAGDAAFLFPFIEMCGNEKSHFINEVMYVYNNELPNNEHNKGLNNAIKYGNYIRTSGKKYNKLIK